jgi:hypothetical protein
MEIAFLTLLQRNLTCNCRRKNVTRTVHNVIDVQNVVYNASTSQSSLENEEGPPSRVLLCRRVGSLQNSITNDGLEDAMKRTRRKRITITITHHGGRMGQMIHINIRS